MSRAYTFTVHKHNCNSSRSFVIIHLSFLVPDPPTDLQAVNVTDSKALLVWKPAKAKVDNYILSYGSTRCKSSSSLMFWAVMCWVLISCFIPYLMKYFSHFIAPNVTVTVMLSGTSVEHQLRGLYRSTLYSAKIMSQINRLQSSAVSTVFTTKSGKAEQLKNLPSSSEH